MGSIATRFLLTILIFFTLLIIEILLAMTIFVYIRLNLPGLFDTLLNLAFAIFNAVRDGLRETAPETASYVNVALVGDLSGNAVLLLMLGLFASGLIRMALYGTQRLMRRNRPAP